MTEITLSNGIHCLPAPQMFVDPEILEALDEEQKQILFIKMREEQVKRWKANEEKYEREGEYCNQKSRDNMRRIRWLKGEDGKDWVWVMGEHKDDLTIEEITEKRALEEARQLAEKEMLESMHLMELTDHDSSLVGPNEDEDTLKEQLSRIEPWKNTSSKIQACINSFALHDLHDSKVFESLYENADSLFDNSNGEINPPFYDGSVAKVFLKGILKHARENLLEHNVTTEQPVVFDAVTESVTLSKPKTNAEFSEKSSLNTNTHEDELNKRTQGSYPNHLSNIPESSRFEQTDVPTDKNLHLVEEQGLPVTIAKSVFCRDQQNSRTIPVNVQHNPIQEINASLVKFRSNSREGHGILDIDNEITKRQSEIFEKIKEKHQQFDREAEQEAKRVEQVWEEQEKRAREAEAQIRRIAQRAREQHRQQSLRTSSSILPALKNSETTSLKEALKSLPRPPKPKSRDAIIRWFRAKELPKGTGFDPITHRPAVWFHGIISRNEADEMLQNKPSGSFLIRVSERIWGYTMSYAVGNGNIKHFLIEKISQGYQFLGTNQIVHKHLHELVAFHEISPITRSGNEILRWAVGQVDLNVPDYATLISE
ncbi:unnamed protein product [Thelazia callipaeda]|uniref:SH2 domain-containing protein n=1 Tax=Thelazia callipaeda TaxID=103827 RepID=A0A0N5CK10_THECL|nr:unnamed protein product [Thelazia callipaeda]